MSERAQPQGVRVVRVDGTTLPVEVMYEGEHDGIDVWLVCGVTLHPGDRIKADTLPAHAAITVAVSTT